MHVAVLRTHRPRMFTGAAQFWQEHVHEKKNARCFFNCLLILHQPCNPAFHVHVLAKFAQRL
jgi:cupin superfamily acireductone dioxygenase involved in methionine salvage